jgi:circadian clock protein KaiC
MEGVHLVAGGQAVSTGVDGLDAILDGGYASHRMHLIEGQPGTGKTTLALQFLFDGRARGEKGFYVTLSDTRDELIQVAETTAGRSTASTSTSSSRPS